jgi:hypothetical protein
MEIYCEARNSRPGKSTFLNISRCRGQRRQRLERANRRECISRMPATLGDAWLRSPAATPRRVARWGRQSGLRGEGARVRFDGARVLRRLRRGSRQGATGASTLRREKSGEKSAECSDGAPRKSRPMKPAKAAARRAGENSGQTAVDASELDPAKTRREVPMSHRPASVRAACCAAGQTCVGGACVNPRCQPGTILCESEGVYNCCPSTYTCCGYVCAPPGSTCCFAVRRSDGVREHSYCAGTTRCCPNYIGQPLCCSATGICTEGCGCCPGLCEVQNGVPICR